MDLDKAKREAARHKKTEAVDSYVAVQKDDPVHSHSDGIKTVSRSGVVARNDKNVGHEAMQRARDVISSVEAVTFADCRAKVGTNDVWFEEHQVSVEQQIKQRLELNRITHSTRVRMLIPNDDSKPIEFDYPPSDTDIDFDNYRPVVDDDAPDYVPMSER